MKQALYAGLCGLFFSQNIDKIINPEVERIERILSADDMQGRKTLRRALTRPVILLPANLPKSKLKFWAITNLISRNLP